jgi:hypothetical protein
MGAAVSFSLLSVHESADLCAAVGRYELRWRPPGAEPQTDQASTAHFSLPFWLEPSLPPAAQPQAAGTQKEP